MANTTSAARTKANRENAQRSTGPRTAEGKAVVKWNAQKHGLLAKEVVISSGEGKESQAEFDQLLEAFTSELKPVGLLEEIQVERIIVAYWRLRRVLRCEAGEIQRGITQVYPNPPQFDEAVVKLAMAVAEYSHAPAESELIKNVSGIVYLRGLMKEFKQRIEESGAVDEEYQSLLVKIFGYERDELGSELLIYNYCAKGGYPMPYYNRNSSLEPDVKGMTAADEAIASGKKPPYEPLEAKQKLLEIFTRKEAAYQKLLMPALKACGMYRDARLASLALPSGEVVARIQRYETTIDRQLSRAMSELERLQKARKGATPPPSSSSLAELN